MRNGERSRSGGYIYVCALLLSLAPPICLYWARLIAAVLAALRVFGAVVTVTRDIYNTSSQFSGSADSVAKFCWFCSFFRFMVLWSTFRLKKLPCLPISNLLTCSIILPLLEYR